jgi:hemin uptake protein HemP
VKPTGDGPGAAPSAPGLRAGPAADAKVPSTSDGHPAAPPPAFRAIASEALFRGAGEVRISHRGSLYRLKQTALGKLILTK